MNNGNSKNIDMIIRLMQTDNSVDAPADALRWSKNIFRSRAAEPQKSRIRQFLAVLKMDLAPNRAAFGERSAAGPGRQMLFEAGANSLDLRINETEKGLKLAGQILGEGFAGATVKLGEFETEANELSEFGFAEIPAGKYDLILRSSEEEIIIKDLELNL